MNDGDADQASQKKAVSAPAQDHDHRPPTRVAAAWRERPRWGRPADAADRGILAEIGGEALLGRLFLVEQPAEDERRRSPWSELSGCARSATANGGRRAVRSGDVCGGPRPTGSPVLRWPSSRRWRGPLEAIRRLEGMDGKVRWKPTVTPWPVMAYITRAITVSRHDSPQPHATGIAATTAAKGTAMKSARLPAPRSSSAPAHHRELRIDTELRT